MKIRLGTRGSRLALTQTNHVAAQLRAAHPDIEVEVLVIQTTGDRILDAPLSRIGGKGVFTKEIEDALLDGRIDAAVHSLKDVPTQQPPGLALAAVGKREDWRDVLLAARPLDWKTLGPEARIGTSSLRRRAELRRGNPHVQVLDLRGNVPTRIGKMLAGEYDAIILAAAGLARLNETAPYIQPLHEDDFLPAPGQGALGLQCRADDEATMKALAVLNDAETAACTTAERAVLHGLGGGCQLPLGTLAQCIDNTLHLRARVLSPEGDRWIEDVIVGEMKEASIVGAALAMRLLESGAKELLRGLGENASGFQSAIAAASAMDALPLGGKTVVVTRDEDSDGPLSMALRELGAHPLCLPLVRHRFVESEALSRAAASIHDYDWVILTSPRAVESLVRSGADFSKAGSISSVGEATARAVKNAGGRVELVASDGTATSLAEALADAGLGDSQTLLYPRSNLANPALAEAIRASGAELTDIVAYETEHTPWSGDTIASLRKNKPTAILFCSPSAVAAFADSLSHDERMALLEGVLVGSMGPTTSKALQDAGHRADFEPRIRTFRGLAKTLAERMNSP